VEFNAKKFSELFMPFLYSTNFLLLFSWPDNFIFFEILLAVSGDQNFYSLTL
jgi:hypothetical protein